MKREASDGVGVRVNDAAGPQRRRAALRMDSIRFQKCHVTALEPHRDRADALAPLDAERAAQTGADVLARAFRQRRRRRRFNTRRRVGVVVVPDGVPTDRGAPHADVPVLADGREHGSVGGGGEAVHRSEVRVTRLGHRSPIAAVEIIENGIVVESFPRDDGAVAAGGHQDLPPRAAAAAAAAARRQRGDRGVVGVRAAAREPERPGPEASWQEGPRLDRTRVAAGDDGAVGEDGDGV
mmetsp:Transcript_637/g.2502  ORF Transcript_637/g.2502 Transcript_637/m.2502 type:complete len:238 (+) Transcript_637:223-936(+)